MNKISIAAIAALAALALWVGNATVAEQGERELGDAFPKKLLVSPESCVTPAWPNEARRYEIEGISVLRFRIGKDGSVQDAKVATSSSWNILDAAALASLVKCRFKPDLDEAKAEATFPIQFVWTMDGEAPMRPSVVEGSCAPSAKFARFKTFQRGQDGADGVLVRLLVDPQGQPFGVKAELGPQQADLAAQAVQYVQSCKFAIDPALKGERTDTTFGRVLYQPG